MTISRTGKPIETERRLVVVRSWKEWGVGRDGKSVSDFLWGQRKYLGISGNDCIILELHFQRLNCMVCELYLNLKHISMVWSRVLVGRRLLSTCWAVAGFSHICLWSNPLQRACGLWCHWALARLGCTSYLLCPPSHTACHQLVINTNRRHSISGQAYVLQKFWHSCFLGYPHNNTRKPVQVSWRTCIPWRMH